MASWRLRLLGSMEVVVVVEGVRLRRLSWEWMERRPWGSARAGATD
jgi:hypothetical protein